MVRRKIHRKDLVLGVAAGFLMILILTFYLWHITENIRLGYDIGKVENERESLRDAVKRLEAAKAALTSPARIEQTAREKLGLTDPRDGQILYEDERGTLLK